MAPAVVTMLGHADRSADLTQTVDDPHAGSGVCLCLPGRGQSPFACHRARSGARQAELNQVERKLGGILRAIEDGAYTPALKQRLTELEERKEALARELAKPKAGAIVALHPRLADVYRDKMRVRKRN